MSDDENRDEMKEEKVDELNRAVQSNISPDIKFFQSPSYLFCFLAVLISECLFLMMKMTGISIHFPAIPMNLGLIKDLLDIVIVVIFPWHGWVFAVPLLVSFIFGAEEKKLASMYFLSTASTALITSIFNFSELSIGIVTRGFISYLSLNIFILLFFFIVKFMIQGVLKCRR